MKIGLVVLTLVGSGVAVAGWFPATARKAVPALLERLPLDPDWVEREVVRPMRWYRENALAPRTLIGADGVGGVVVRNRSGDLFRLGAHGGVKLAVPRSARVGKARGRAGGVALLEFQPFGDYVWRFEDGGHSRRRIGTEQEPVLAADLDWDGERLVVLDAMAPRLVWLERDGRISQTTLVPVERGVPRLLAMDGGKLRLLTTEGAVATLGVDGTWSFASTELPPGAPLEFDAAGEALFLLVRREGRDRLFRWEEPRGWTDGGRESEPNRLALDRDGRIFRIDEDFSVYGGEAGGTGPWARLGAPRPLVDAFDSTFVGRLVRRLE